MSSSRRRQRRRRRRRKRGGAASGNASPSSPASPARPTARGPRISLATFNAENLYARYRYADLARSDRKKMRRSQKQHSFDLSSKRFTILSDKRFTAMSIREANADIICLQEVESLRVLERFRDQHLRELNYTHAALLDSHDPRLISQGVLSRFPIESICPLHREAMAPETQVPNPLFGQMRVATSDDSEDEGEMVPEPEFITRPAKRLFSRSVQDVLIRVDETHCIRILNAHLRSMSRGREDSAQRRREQANYIRDFVRDTLLNPATLNRTSWGSNVVVLGDLNDHNDRQSALRGLLRSPLLFNISERLPPAQRWTQYCARKDEYAQLDYMLISKALADANTGSVPRIVRHGLPRRANRYVGRRWNGIGRNYPKASDHAPMMIRFRLL